MRLVNKKGAARAVYRILKCSVSFSGLTYPLKDVRMYLSNEVTVKLHIEETPKPLEAEHIQSRTFVSPPLSMYD